LIGPHSNPFFFDLILTYWINLKYLFSLILDCFLVKSQLLVSGILIVSTPERLLIANIITGLLDVSKLLDIKVNLHIAPGARL
jgi:hypothetical protein